MQALLDTIRARAGAAPVALGLVLGSGLGHLAGAVDGVGDRLRRPAGLSRTPASPATSRASSSASSKASASPSSAAARTTTRPATPTLMRRPLEMLRALGADRLILTNAAGSFRPDIPPGELMLLSDHINFSGRNPLIGEPTDARFVSMTDAYDPELRRALAAAAAAEGVAARPKASTPGTPARASRPRPRSARSRILGADAVGMSTVPEVILARFLGLRVAAISTITNMAAGMSDEAISHEPHQGDGPARRRQARARAPPLSCAPRRPDRRRTPKPSARCRVGVTRAGVRPAPATRPRRKPHMALKSLDDLFVHFLRDIYYAEKQILKALPKMARKANSDQLREAFESHLAETEEHVANLEKVFELLDLQGPRRHLRGDRRHPRGRQGDHDRGRATPTPATPA